MEGRGDHDSDPEDPEKLLNAWLGELDSLTMGLERTNSTTSSGSSGSMRPLSSDLNSPRIDSYRFSMANMEETQDIDLDAILGELCALESQYDEAIQSSAKQTEVVVKEEGSKAVGGRTHSPDNDSAFSDCVSLMSSESSASSGRGALSSKEDKMRLALQKMKEASVKKLFIKVFSDDGSAKSLLVDEGMSCGYVTRILAEKNHRQLEPQCALVEHLTDLHMERVYEDHELLVEQLMLWTRDSKNKLIFTEREKERCSLFKRPELVLGPLDAPTASPQTHQADHFANTRLLEEFFCGCGVPSVEGPLYLKTDSRKGWKRQHCVLRASGLYYWPKDRAKSRDLTCLATFDVNQVYYGVGWKKKYKAPTEFCFAIKHPCLQQPKSAKYVKFLCADDEETLHRWVTAIRVIKYGRQLVVNHRCVVEEWGLGGGHLPSTPPSPPSPPSSESSGCCGDAAFDTDFPSGTIKRKPAKLPLTATTRQLKEMATCGEEEYDAGLSLECLPPPPPELLMDDDDEEEERPEAHPPRHLDTGRGGVAAPPPPRLLAPPSTAFLEDLQRVMRRKWQVAQKCALDSSTCPHEVLGFREVPAGGAAGGSAGAVSQWVQEHYGGSRASRRPPPPPPPPRAITTHLSTRLT